MCVYKLGTNMGSRVGAEADVSVSQGLVKVRKNMDMYTIDNKYLYVH